MRRLVVMAVFGSVLVAPAVSADVSSRSASTVIPAPLTLVSSSEDGVKGSSISEKPDMSANGTLVAFESRATNLTTGDTGSEDDIYVKDVVTGEVVFASTTDAGIEGNDYSELPSISGDGSRVAFDSAATNLDLGDTDSTLDVYVKELATGDITLASTSDTGVKGNGDSTETDLASLGTKVAFASYASNLDPGDTDASRDVFVKNLNTGNLTLVSTPFGGGPSNGEAYEIDFAQSGNRVAFYSTATNLDPADTDNYADVYVKDLTTGALFLASTSDTGVNSNLFAVFPAISGGGRHVAFASLADNLDPADIDNYYDIYVKDLTTGELTLVSTSDDGVKGNRDSLNPQISGDGNRVTFASASDNLDPGDDDATLDVYVKDLETGDLSLVSADTNGVKGDQNSDYPAISGGGASVAFETAARNWPGDSDFFNDVYVKEPLMCTVVGTSGPDFPLSGTDGDDVICGRGGGDTIEAGAGNDIVFGEGGVDILAGEEGTDTLLGGDDGDYLVGGPDADVLEGEAGEDIVTYSESPAEVDVDLAANTGAGGNAEGDTFSSIENLSGSPFDDLLAGNGGDNDLFGHLGNDVLTPGAGTDTVDGEAGTDTVSYALSPAALTVDLAAQTVAGGDAAGDAITSVEGAIGSAFADSLTGDANTNVFMGMAGADVLTGAAGFDIVYYLYSGAAVTLNLGANTASGGHAAGDVLSGFEGAVGSAFGDTLTGSATVNTLTGQGGNDTMVGQSGNDTLTGGDGTDTFYGGPGTDTCDDVVGETVTSCEV